MMLCLPSTELSLQILLHVQFSTQRAGFALSTVGTISAYPDSPSPVFTEETCFLEETQGRHIHPKGKRQSEGWEQTAVEQNGVKLNYKLGKHTNPTQFLLEEDACNHSTIQN